MNMKTELVQQYRGHEYWIAFDDDAYDGEPLNTYPTEQEAIDAFLEGEE